MSRDERRERQADEIDTRAALARRDLEAAYAGLREAEAWLRDNPYADASERVAYAKTVEMWQSTIDRADRRLAAAQADETKLHGLAAPTEHIVEVTSRDAIIDELNAELAALGEDVTS